MSHSLPRMVRFAGMVNLPILRLPEQTGFIEYFYCPGVAHTYGWASPILSQARQNPDSTSAASIEGGELKSVVIECGVGRPPSLRVLAMVMIAICDWRGDDAKRRRGRYGLSLGRPR